MRVGHVTDVSDPERLSRRLRELPGQQADDEFRGAADARAEERPEDAGRVEHDQLRPSAVDVVPGGALSDHLRERVRRERLARLRPVRLGPRSTHRPSVPDRRERRRQHNAPYAASPRRRQHPQRALAGGDDEVVRVLGLRQRDRRRHVQHAVAAGNRLGPAEVVHQVGGHELDARRSGATLCHHRSDRVGANQVADGRAHIVARSECSDDRVRPEVAGATGHENLAHLMSLPAFSSATTAASASVSPASRAAHSRALVSM